nr:helix-turn-helix transcriptional regulator [Maliibacterium massiliense]
MSYYVRLKDLREDADLTQAQVGKILGTTQQQYYKYEKGLREIPAHHLIVLAEFYDVSVDYLLGRTNDRHAQNHGNK